MTHGSLFTGIGGFDLASEAMGWENKFTCEINEFCRKNLKYYWPNAKHLKDIRTEQFIEFINAIDILTGGFPCQPLSLAGKRLGIADDRYLWPEMLRAIKIIRPRWVVAENVFGIINWNKGLVFDTVQSDLEAEGYEVFTYVLPIAGVDAPHERYRVWFIAHAAGNRRKGERSEVPAKERQEKSGIEGVMAQRPEGLGITGVVANSNSIIVQGGGQDWKQITRDKIEGWLSRCNSTGGYWQEWPTQSPICGRDDGIPPRLDGIAVSKWRRESIIAYGNSVSPVLVMNIFRAIEEYEKKQLKQYA